MVTTGIGFDGYRRTIVMVNGGWVLREAPFVVGHFVDYESALEAWLACGCVATNDGTGPTS